MKTGAPQQGSDTSPSPAPASPAAEAEPRQAGGGGLASGMHAERRTVWIVDDDETSLLLGQEILTEHGFTVEAFSDCARALARARASKPDIIVLDVMMPGMSGFEFCSRLRTDPLTCDVPVLMVTSLNDPASIARGYDVGATNFATKPINWDAEGHRLRYMLRAAETAEKLRAAEKVARAATDEWERTFNAISDVVTILDPDLRIVRANRAAEKAAKKPLAAIVGAKCFEVFVGSHAPCQRCPVAEALGTGRQVAAELRYAVPGIECMVIGTPLPAVTGQAPHAVHIARDLTHQKTLEAQYLHAQKLEAVGTLAGGIAHDFNNILAVVRSNAELLTTELRPKGGDVEEMLEAILDASMRGASLARQLLTFSRSGTGSDERSALVVNDVVRDLTKLLGRLIPKSITVRTELDPRLCSVRGSADQLGQVVMNLAVNALHAMPDGGVLGLETRTVELQDDECRSSPVMRPGRFACLVVSDTGHGMDENTMRRMFEPFFTTKEVGRGTGLGLSVAYGIVKEHGGWISCSSQVGSGTTFRIYLPACSDEGELATAASGTATAARAAGATILVVDDDACVRTAMESALRRNGYSVLVAEDGEQALARYAEERRIRLVVMDLGMPGIDGWECLRRLRAVDPDVQVLVNTGYGGADLADRAARDGAAGLIRKPFGLDELLAKVAELLHAGSPSAGPRAA